MTAKEVARLAGISVRTLHHYDEIGLVSPRRNKENGYRDYTGADLAALQQVLFFRACGFPLADIRRMLHSPDFDALAAFELQRKALEYEKQRIEGMLQTLDKSIQSMKGDYTMQNEERFTGLDFSHNPYEDEARRLWGDDAVKKSKEYVKGLGKEGQKKLEQSFGELFQSLSEVRGEDPTGETAQRAMGEMYRYFNQNFGYTYTPEAFGNLGQMYVDDARFTKNIDKYGEGLAAFLAKAMAAYAAAHDGGE